MSSPSSTPLPHLQKAGSCDWCGKFVVIIDSTPRANSTKKSFEIMRDDQDRLLQAYDGNLILAEEHRCKVRCGACGALIIFEAGKLFDRVAMADSTSKTQQQNERRSHKCTPMH